MAEIKRDSIPLDHDLEVLAIIHALGLKPVPRSRSDPPITEYWQPYFFILDRQVWKNGVETWMRAEDGFLKRIVVSGLKDEREARALRREWDHRRPRETFEQIVKRITTDDDREARERHETFLSCLRYVRTYFSWEDGAVVEGSGRLGLPLSKIKLSAEDKEVLRQVFMRLQERSFAPDDFGIERPIKVDDAACPTCGGKGQRKRSVVKDLKTAREKVKQHSGAYADEGFAAWVDQCLQTKTTDWSPARTQLYAHYREWVRKGGHGGNRGEKAEAKATVLSEVKWGQLMRLRFPDACDRRKTGMFYRVKVKRGA